MTFSSNFILIFILIAAKLQNKALQRCNLYSSTGTRLIFNRFTVKTHQKNHFGVKSDMIHPKLLSQTPQGANLEKILGSIIFYDHDA